ncbi:MAG: HupE/UreJ family protein [Acidimicrobiia bacterium]
MSRRSHVPPRAHAARLSRVACSSGALAITALLASATPASAHIGGPTHGFADGLLHPLTGPDHLLAMLAVGLIAALVAARTPNASISSHVTLPATFVVAMVIGGALGIAGVTSSLVEVTIAASVVALGIAVAAANRCATPWILPLVAAAGLAHGNAHGIEAPSAVHPVLYVAGFVTATVALHAIGVLSGTGLTRRPALRLAVAAVITTAGMLLVA